MIRKSGHRFSEKDKKIERDGDSTKSHLAPGNIDGDDRSSAADPAIRQGLFDPPPPEEALVGRVLFDVGRVALLQGVHVRRWFRALVCRLGIITCPFVTSIGGRYRRHMTMFGHSNPQIDAQGNATVAQLFKACQAIAGQPE
jgi:hypothetical protein